MGARVQNVPRNRAEENRQEMVFTASVIKLGAVAAVIASLFLLAIFQNPFILVLAGVVTYAAKEVWAHMDNMTEIAQNRDIEIHTRIVATRDAALNHACRGAPIILAILRMTAPPDAHIQLNRRLSGED